MIVLNYILYSEKKSRKPCTTVIREHSITRLMIELKGETDFVSITDCPLLSTNKCSYFEEIIYKTLINLTYYLPCLFAFMIAKVLISQDIQLMSTKCFFLFSNFTQAR